MGQLYSCLLSENTIYLGAIACVRGAPLILLCFILCRASFLRVLCGNLIRLGFEIFFLTYCFGLAPSIVFFQKLFIPITYMQLLLIIRSDYQKYIFQENVNLYLNVFLEFLFVIFKALDKLQIEKKDISKFLPFQMPLVITQDHLNIQILELLTYSRPMAQLRNDQPRLGYLKPANPIKVGIFYNKDQKILALEQQNQKLRKQLEKELAQYNDLVKSNQEAQSKFSRMKNQQSLLEVQQQMLIQSVEKLTRKVQENSPIIKNLTQKVEEMTEENSRIQQELEEQLKISNENEKLIKRYKEQIKTEKLMLKSQKNITKISETFKKNYQINQKYIEILENKLESKKKYLAILTKKAEKEKRQETQQAKGQKDRKSTIIMNPSKTKMSALTNSNFNTKKQQKGQVKSNMKSYNDLIRKKNAVLAQRK